MARLNWVNAISAAEAGILAVCGAVVVAHGLADSNPVNGELDGGPIVGEMAPDFTLPDLSGRMVSLSSFRGKPVVLGFFCGCYRCREAATKIGKLQRQGNLSNLVAVVGLDVDGARDFQRSTCLQGEVLIDPSDSVSERYASDFCPRFWLTTRSGTIEYRSGTGLQAGELDDALANLTHLDASWLAR